ncbi:MAG: flavodoxin family protein [Deltaproteobacteria bacterium HGW-Deltaproteobacteria-1]|nr:MAG: flavodoxin family protein [Deltaproteobacteria bacterium HGW-Deltaproteobacteria-1]
MKVIGINGSPRKNGNTSILIKAVFHELKKEGIETELINIALKPVRGCKGCYKCLKNQNKRCVFDDDIVNECIEKMITADGIILGSPTYFTDVTAEMKALIDRAGTVSIRGGAIHAFDTMNHFMHYMQMYLVGASYWNMAYGFETGEVNNDKEGMENMKTLGENMAYLLKKIKS